MEQPKSPVPLNFGVGPPAQTYAVLLPLMEKKSSSGVTFRCHQRVESGKRYRDGIKSGERGRTFQPSLAAKSRSNTPDQIELIDNG